MTKVIPFKPEHLQSLDGETFSRLGLVPDWLKKAEHFNGNGTCFSGFADGQFVACAGISILWPGVGEAWAVITPNIYKHPLFFHKSIVQGLNTIIEKHNLYRVQATVLSGFEKGDEWIKRLGFEPEGIMRKYDAEGLDHTRYAKVM